MAESISEGTLKQWIKKTGDYVKADEEVATIETDKIDVSVNAPKSGTIVETLANEEDTVTVGQDLFKIEPGEGPTDSPSKSSEVKSGAKDEGEAKQLAEETHHKPQPRSDAPEPDPATPKPSAQDRKRWADVDVEKKEAQPSRPEPQLTETKQPAGRTDFGEKPSTGSSESAKPGLFDRTERRVCDLSVPFIPT